MEIKDLKNKINAIEKRLDKLEKKQWQFTEKEKTFLSFVNKNYNYIAKDRDGELFMYENKPSKRETYWVNESGDFFSIENFSLDFKLIKWSDNEPCNFRKHIGDVE